MPRKIPKLMDTIPLNAQAASVHCSLETLSPGFLNLESQRLTTETEVMTVDRRIESQEATPSGRREATFGFRLTGIRLEKVVAGDSFRTAGAVDAGTSGDSMNRGSAKRRNVERGH